MSEGNDANDEEHHALRSDSTPRIAADMDRPYAPKPLGERSKAVKRQSIMVILGNLGAMSSGMGLGLPAITNGSMMDTTAKVFLTLSEFTWFASLNLFSAPLGGLLSALLLDKWGRKMTMYAFNIVGLISWILMAVASRDDQQAMLIELMVSRFVIGIASGLSSAPVGVYSAEISTPKIRGRLILGTSIGVAAGTTLIYLMGYFIRTDWRLIAILCCIFQIIAMLCVIPLPETPNWLISKSRLPEARKSLNYFRGLDKKDVITHPEVLAEFNALQKHIQMKEGETKISFIKSLRLPEVYKPLLILIGMFTFQQVTGIFVVIVYAVQISKEVGVTIDPFMCAIMIGLARLISTCPMVYSLEKWGRRGSGIVSGLGMAVCMGLLAAHNQPVIGAIPYLPVIAIISFIVLSTVGLFTLPFIMMSEVFPQKVRGPAAGLTVAYGTFVAFVCTKTYPSMKGAIGNEYTFLVYCILSLVAAVFVYMYLPETRGRTLVEIEEGFRSGNSRKIPPPVDLDRNNQR